MVLRAACAVVLDDAHIRLLAAKVDADAALGLRRCVVALDGGSAH